MCTFYYSRHLDDILTRYRGCLSGNYEAYRNHCYRVLNYALMHIRYDDITFHKISIAVAFSGLGIWNSWTTDHIRTSVALAKDYLKDVGQIQWSGEIVLMISAQNKLTAYRGESRALVEAVRRANWTDLTMGVLNFNLEIRAIDRVRSFYRNNGFQKLLLKLTAKRLLFQTLSLLPMFKL